MDYIQLSIRLPSEVAISLRTWARDEKKPLAVIIREICLAAVTDRERAVLVHSIIPEINQVLDQRLSAFSNRMAHFMMRTFLESATTRKLLLETAFHQLSDEDLSQLNSQAWASSVKSLKVTSEELQTLQRNLREGLL